MRELVEAWIQASGAADVAELSVERNRLPKAIAEAASVAVALVGGDAAVLGLWRNQRGASMKIVSRTGEQAASLVELLRALGSPSVGRNEGPRLLRFSSRAYAEKEKGARNLLQNGVRAALVVPFLSREGPLGMLAVGRSRAEPFAAEEEHRLLDLAGSLRGDLLRWKNAEMTKGIRRPGRLTPRERQIVQLLAADKTCKEVAAELELSARTVEHHVERLKTRHRQSTIHGLIGYLTKLGI